MGNERAARWWISPKKWVDNNEDVCCVLLNRLQALRLHLLIGLTLVLKPAADSARRPIRKIIIAIYFYSLDSNSSLLKTITDWVWTSSTCTSSQAQSHDHMHDQTSLENYRRSSILSVSSSSDSSSSNRRDLSPS